jgi:hypothetical protein
MRITIIVLMKFMSFLSILILIVRWFLNFRSSWFCESNQKKRFFWRRRFFKLRDRRFYEETSRFFDRSHLFDRAEVEFEFDLIKIRSSLIVNVRRIFIKYVVKRSRDAEKIKFKSNDCLIKILSSLIVNAKRIFINSIRSFD